MSMPTGKKRDTTVVLLTLLFVVTGLVDATSILGLGRVFTANMTGNVVFLGFAIAGASGFHWVPYIAALLSFAFGVVMGGRLGRRYAPRGRRRWLIIAAVVEASLLWTAAACSLPAASSSTAWVPYVLTGLTAAGRRPRIVRGCYRGCVVVPSPRRRRAIGPCRAGDPGRDAGAGRRP